MTKHYEPWYHCPPERAAGLLVIEHGGEVFTKMATDRDAGVSWRLGVDDHGVAIAAPSGWTKATPLPAGHYEPNPEPEPDQLAQITELLAGLRADLDQIRAEWNHAKASRERDSR